MSTRCHVATRKGLFTVDRGVSGWSISRANFLGDNCTLVMHDPRDGARGALTAALNHGHFGVKLDPNIQDPHLVAQCGANPDVLWVQHHNGIFRSTDAARSWSEITDVKPSAFGFAVAVHPHDPDTAWFVPAIKDEKRYPVDGRVVVNRTRDGGRTFETLSRGLPQEHAYDLVFRHALDVDETGNRLAFGSSTGSLWVSEDGGDSWSTVSANLPPIYAVRFEKTI